MPPSTIEAKPTAGIVLVVAALSVRGNGGAAVSSSTPTLVISGGGGVCSDPTLKAVSGHEALKQDGEVASARATAPLPPFAGRAQIRHCTGLAHEKWPVHKTREDPNLAGPEFLITEFSTPDRALKFLGFA